ncbi:MAG: helitron helicase-like domain-containing protein [Gloeomargaritales cyanobacterium]
MFGALIDCLTNGSVSDGELIWKINNSLVFKLLLLQTERWSPNRKTVQNKPMTLRCYYKFMLQERSNASNAIMKGRTLLQQYVVMAFAREQSQKLRWISNNQRTLRAESYQTLQANVTPENREGIGHGRQIILPHSFHGSKRWYKRRNYEAMAIARAVGRPDLFITMTCNPKHPQILGALPAGMKAEDRPDLVARIFKQQVEEMKGLLIGGKVPTWEKAKGLIYVIEWQKRGLPHAHLLLILDREFGIREDEISKYTRGEIPDNNIIREDVLGKMIHRPCGVRNPTATCCNNRFGRCSSYFPKAYSDQEYFDFEGRAVCRRRSPENGGNSAVTAVRNHVTTPVTNEWVVPYNPFLLQHFNSHINVEIVTSLQVIKYLLWYPFKVREL